MTTIAPVAGHGVEFLRMLNAKDDVGLLALLADDAQIVDELTRHWVRGRSAIGTALRTAFSRVSDVHSEALDLHVDAGRTSRSRRSSSTRRTTSTASRRAWSRRPRSCGAGPRPAGGSPWSTRSPGPPSGSATSARSRLSVELTGDQVRRRTRSTTRSGSTRRTPATPGAWRRRPAEADRPADSPGGPRRRRRSGASFGHDDDTLVRPPPAQLHLPGHPDRADLRAHGRAGPGGRGRRVRARDRDGPPLPDPGDRRARRADARGLVRPRGARARDEPGPPRDARERRDLPQPGAARQAGDDPRRAVRRAGGARASAPPGTRPSTWASDSTSRRSASGWTGSRRRSRSRGRCSPRTARRSTAATTGSRRPATSRGRSSRAARGSSSAGSGSSGPCAWPRSYADLTHWFAARARGPAAQDRGPRGLLRGDRARPGDDRADDARPRDGRGDRGRGAGDARRPSPEEGRVHLFAGTPEQCADAMRPYLDAGFTGFTFRNTVLRTPDQIAVAGELLRLIGG